VYGVPPGHEGSPAGCAGGLHVMTVEDDAVVSQSVDVWCRDLVRTVETNIIPSLCNKNISTIKKKTGGS